ncbi:MAG: glycosyltransferase [Pseudomonadales bacterium]
MASDAPLNILQISHNYQAPFRMVCHQYAQALNGHRVTTLYLKGKQQDDVEAGTGGERVIFLDEGSLRGMKLSTVLHVAKLFRREKYDVVIAHRYKAIYIAGMMSLFFPIKVLLGVAHEHGVFKRFSRSLFVKYICKDMHVIAVSETVKRDIVECVPALNVQNRISTLNHALDANLKENLMSRADARTALGLDQDTWYFGTVGRLVSKKRHEILIDALARSELFNVRLVLVGGGPQESSLKQQAVRLGLEERIVFAGAVNDAWRYLKAFDAFVLTSGAEEAFGIVLLEAMLAEIPIISSDAPGPKEVAGDAALFFASGDAADLEQQMEKVAGMDRTALDHLTRAGFRRLGTRFDLAGFRERLWSVSPLARLVNSSSQQVS